MTTTQSSIEPPTFQLPDDFHSNRSRYELWSVRAPVKFDVKSLDGSKITFSLAGNGSAWHVGSNNTGAGSLVSSVFNAGGTSHGFALGHSVESDSFRILATDASEKGGNGSDDDDASSDDGDDEGANNKPAAYKGKTMKPLPIPFDRHVNIVQCHGEGMRDIDLAPSAERAPPTGDDVKVRLAYAPIPQVAGLKRRWAMKGGDAKPGSAVGGKASVSANVKEKGGVPSVKRRKVGSNEIESAATTPETKKSSSKKKDRSSSKKDKKKKKKKKKEKKNA